MRNAGVILILVWMLFRMLFHAFSFENSELLTFLYFGGNDIALVGLFMVLYSMVRKRYHKRLLKIVLMYSGFCLVTDILMLLGIGAHDFWLFTAIGISILALGILWVIYV